MTVHQRVLRPLTRERLALMAGGVLVTYLVAVAYRKWATGRLGVTRAAALRDDDALDNLLTDSFPASDPPSWTTSGALT